MQQPVLAPLPPRWEERVIRRSIAHSVIEKARRVEEFVRRLQDAAPSVQRAASVAQNVVRKTGRREGPPRGEAIQLRPAPIRPAAPEARSAADPARLPVESEPRTPQPPQAPAINLDALTSQVMDQIDRRVIAWRERMGKF
jgi:hypothetical protein